MFSRKNRYIKLQKKIGLLHERLLEKIKNAHLSNDAQKLANSHINMLESKNYISSNINDLLWFYDNGLSKKDSILDFGTGGGYIAYLVADFVKRITAYEYRGRWIDQKYDQKDYCSAFSFTQKIINELEPSIQFRFYQKLPLKQKKEIFDGIISYAVIEHIDSEILNKVFKELYRLLKPGGMLYIAKLPRLYSYQEFLARKLKLESHSNLYTKNKIAKLLNKYSFEIVKIEQTGLFFNYTNKITNGLFPVTNLLEKIMQPLPINFFSHDYRLIAKKYKNESSPNTEDFDGELSRTTGGFLTIPNLFCRAGGRLLTWLRYPRPRLGRRLIPEHGGSGYSPCSRCNKLVNNRRIKTDKRSLYGPKYYKAGEFGFKSEERADHQRILELLNIKTNDKVLEIGCGFGVLLNKIPAKKKIGTETNEFVLQECRKRGLLVIKNDGESGLPFRDSFFDIVILNEVIEHLRKPEFVFKECFRVLMPGGRMIITTSARNFFVSNLSKTHFSEMSVSETKELVQKCGFEILIQEVCGISFLYPFLENFFFKPFRLLKKIFNKKNKKTAGLIDNCHVFADKTILRPLNFYRRNFLWLGQSQLILAQKR